MAELGNVRLSVVDGKVGNHRGILFMSKTI